MCHIQTTAERSSPAYSSTFQKRNEIASGKETKVRGLIHYSNLRLIARLSHRVVSESMRQNLIVQHQNCVNAAVVLPTRGDTSAYSKWRTVRFVQGTDALSYSNGEVWSGRVSTKREVTWDFCEYTSFKKRFFLASNGWISHSKTIVWQSTRVRLQGAKPAATPILSLPQSESI